MFSPVPNFVQVDLESQYVLSYLPRPNPVHHPIHALPRETSKDSLDDFFVHSAKSGLDQRVSQLDAPPAYSNEELPPYSKREEPPTLARYLFIYGFFFFPLWILGAIVLFLPLRAPKDNTCWLISKTAAEKETLIKRVRMAEVRWARRCLFALVSLLMVVALIGLGIWTIGTRYF
jgi:hypothetical protein